MLTLAKKAKRLRITKRDWLLGIMFAAIIATNIMWYMHAQTQRLSDEADATSWLNQQVQINNLKACIDEGTKPCDITYIEQEN